jgi:hypothetical protein
MELISLDDQPIIALLFSLFTMTRIRAGRPRNLVAILGRVKRFLSSSKHPNRLWGPFIQCLPGGKATRV